MMFAFLRAIIVGTGLVLSSIGVMSNAQPVPKGITAAALPDARVIHPFASCVVAKHRSAASTYVLNNNTDWRASPRSVPRALQDRNCLPAEASTQDAMLLLKLSENSIRAALAEALVGQEFPSFDAAVIKTAKPLPSGTLVDSLFPPGACKNCDAEQDTEFKAARAKLNNVMAPIIFGECAVRTDPADSHALLMTTPGSSGEAASFNDLAAAFSSCLVQGSQFTASRSTLRGLIAISYYRIARAPRVELAGAQK